jgi:malonyl CoA-acyl carrier protein transacylase
MAVAGFSVGELTALIFTGAITFSEGISLVKIRGEAMQVRYPVPVPLFLCGSRSGSSLSTILTPAPAIYCTGTVF